MILLRAIHPHVLSSWGLSSKHLQKASTIEETEGNPCSTTKTGGGDVVIDCDFEGIGSLEISQTYPCSTTEQRSGDGDVWIDCDFEGIGELEIEKGTEGETSSPGIGIGVPPTG